jgi:hypothetical protein
MPIVKRTITPEEISRVPVPKGIHNELECVTNSTLSNIIRQLSTLSKHVEDTFGELYSEADQTFKRINQLQERIERLRVKVTQLDSTAEEGECVVLLLVFGSVLFHFQHQYKAKDIYR